MSDRSFAIPVVTSMREFADRYFPNRYCSCSHNWWRFEKFVSGKFGGIKLWCARCDREVRRGR